MKFTGWLLSSFLFNPPSDDDDNDEDVENDNDDDDVDDGWDSEANLGIGIALLWYRDELWRMEWRIEYK